MDFVLTIIHREHEKAVKIRITLLYGITPVKMFISVQLKSQISQIPNVLWKFKKIQNKTVNFSKISVTLNFKNLTKNSKVVR